MDQKELAKILGLDPKNPKIVFQKQNFSPEKIGVEPIFNRMFLNGNFKSEILRINNDIKSAFSNLLKIGVHKTEIPILSEALFENLMIHIDRSNKTLLSDQSAPEFTKTELKKISETQHKIYKILYKIEEDLIDEQDTSIKDINKTNANLLKQIQELLNNRDKDLEEKIKELEEQLMNAENNSGGSSIFSDIASMVGGALGTLGTGALGLKKLFGNNPEALESAKKAHEKAQRNAERRNKVKEGRQKQLDEAKKTKDQQKINESQKKLDEAKKNAKKANEELKKTENELKKRGGKPTTKPESSGKPITPKPNTKLPPKIANALKTAGKAFGKACIVADIFILLPYEVYNFYDFSCEKYPDFGPVDRFLYCTVAGLTQWVKDHLTIFADISQLIKEGLQFLMENWEIIDDGSSLTTGILTTLFKAVKFAIDWLLDLVIDINKDLVDVVMTATGAKCGDECGIIAVNAFNLGFEDFKNYCKNNVPNETTLELILGTNKTLNELQRKGIYEWNTLGYSKLKYNDAVSVAHHITEGDIKEILKHNDVSDETKTILENALKIKQEQNITDRDVLKDTYEEPYLDSLMTILNDSGNYLDKKWLEFIQSVVGYSREMILHGGYISYHYNLEKKSGEVQRKAFLSEDQAESIFSAIFSRYKGQYTFLGFSSEEVLFFTVYGTLLNVHYGFRPKNPINPDPKSSLKVKVLGYIDKSREFHENKINPADEIMKEVLKRNDKIKITNTNIIADEVIKPVSDKSVSQNDVQGVMSSSLPTHLAMTTGYSESLVTTHSESSETNTFSELPSYVQNSYAQTDNYGSDSVPVITKQYSDYLSTEAIMNAQIIEKNGKWFCPNNPFVDAVIQIESMRRANAKAPGTSASGLFQFVTKTGKQFGLRNPFDPYDSLEAFKKYTLYNIKILKRKGIPITPANVYLTHQQGPGGLPMIYNAITKGTGISDGVLRNMRGNTHGHRFSDPVSWYNNWVNDIANLMGTSAQTISGVQSTPETISQNFESPQNYSSPASPSNTSNAMQSVPSYIPRDGNIGGSTMTYAANFATQQAQKNGRHSTGYCARYVANALEASGLKFQRQPSAYLYHTRGILKQAGFGLVSVGLRGYTPEKGDVCVVNRFGSHVHGHICIFNGNNWISDFIQNNPSPYRDGPGDSGLFFYRYGGADVSPNENFSGIDSSANIGTTDYYQPNFNKNQQSGNTNVLVNQKQPGEPNVPEGALNSIFFIPLERVLA